jgi:precorrin-6A/cobalt-precorrin-6A reductase
MRPSLADVRILLLGGTAEARALAAEFVERGVDVTSSLAGRVSNPALPVGAVRVGGFGGAHGLAAYLGQERITHVVDATHPFAATITRNVAAAAPRSGVPLTLLRRPGWTERTNDDWTWVPTITGAARLAAAAPAGTVLLTTGRRDLAAFADDPGHHYLVRTVDPAPGPTPTRSTSILARGPYTRDGELALMREHAVTLLVTKDSGGALTVAKLDAARDLAIPVVVVERPPLPEGLTACASVAQVLAQLGFG